MLLISCLMSLCVLTSQIKAFGLLRSAAVKKPTCLPTEACNLKVADFFNHGFCNCPRESECQTDSDLVLKGATYNFCGDTVQSMKKCRLGELSVTVIGIRQVLHCTCQHSNLVPGPWDYIKDTTDYFCKTSPKCKPAEACQVRDKILDSSPSKRLSNLRSLCECDQSEKCTESVDGKQEEDDIETMKEPIKGILMQRESFYCQKQKN